jgi:hypothetical protein
MVSRRTSRKQEFVGALCLIPGFYARWAALYAVPMMLGAARFWSLRKGFYFAAAGSELPVVWSVMLIVLALLGDGIWAETVNLPAAPRLAGHRHSVDASRLPKLMKIVGCQSH